MSTVDGKFFVGYAVVVPYFRWWFMSSSTDLCDLTRHLLLHRPRTLSLTKIQAETGLGLGWLKTLQARDDHSPNVKDTQRLYEYLTGRPLLPHG